MSHVMRKSVFVCMRPGKTQAGLLSYIDKLESRKFIFSKCMYYTVKAANNKDADRTARKRREQIFSRRGSHYFRRRREKSTQTILRVHTASIPPVIYFSFRMWSALHVEAPDGKQILSFTYYIWLFSSVAHMLFACVIFAYFSVVDFKWLLPQEVCVVWEQKLTLFYRKQFNSIN